MVDLGNFTPGPQETSRRLRRRSRRSPLVTYGVILLVGVVAGGAVAVWLGREKPLVLKPIDDQTVDELDALELTVELQDPTQARETLRYTLRGAPPGAQIDPESGKLTWQPTEAQGPDVYEMTVRAEAAGRKGRSAERRFKVLVREVPQPPVLEPIDDRTVEAGGTLAFRVHAKDPDVPKQALRFGLGRGAPDHARIDPASGQFRWTPRDAKPGEVYQITVQARKGRASGPIAECAFRVTVEEADTIAAPDPDFPVDQLVEELRQDEAEVAVAEDPLAHPPLSGKPRWLTVDGQPVAVFGYETAQAAQQDAAAVTPESLVGFIQAQSDLSSANLFRRDRLIAFYAGSEATLLNLLDAHLGRPVLRKTAAAAPPTEDAPKEPTVSSDEEAGDEIIVDLHRNRRLLSKTEYPTLRKVFAGRFESRHQDQIRQAFGDQDSEMQRWLDEHVDIQEELYLAIDPEHDNVPMALALFRELRERFGDQFEPYAGLAIAVAVVWDDERRGVHRSPTGQHKSTMPEGALGAIENFRYFLDTEQVMQGRARFLPWDARAEPFVRHVCQAPRFHLGGVRRSGVVPGSAQAAGRSVRAVGRDVRTGRTPRPFLPGPAQIRRIPGGRRATGGSHPGTHRVDSVVP